MLLVEDLDTPTDGSPCAMPTLCCNHLAAVQNKMVRRYLWGFCCKVGLVHSLCGSEFWMCVLLQQKHANIRFLDTPTMQCMLMDHPLASYSDFPTYFGSIRILACQGMPWQPWNHLELRSHHATLYTSP